MRTKFLVSKPALTLISVLVSMVFAPHAFAQSVSQVKGNKVLMDIGGDSVVRDDDMFCLDGDQKKRGLLRVTQVKNARAVGDIVKGTCEVGMGVRVRRKATAAAETTSTPPPSTRTRTPRGPGKGNSWGVIGGYHMDTAAASFRYLGQSREVSMTGTGFSVMGLYDYNLTSTWQFRGLAGIETFNTTGSITGNACNKGTSSSCDFSLMNLSMQGLAKYNFTQGKYRSWAGGGIGYIFALSKSSNVIDTANLSTNWLFTLAGGVDIALASGAYIPVSIEYSQYPDSDTVKASFIAIRGGWAKSF